MRTLLQGIVEHGDARGRELGFPTANLPIHDRPELDGIWAAHADVEGHGRFLATVSIGRRPTYYPDGAMRLVEVHLLDFSESIYGLSLRVELVRFLRGQQRFSGSGELVVRIAMDVAATRDILAPQREQVHLPWLGLVPA